MRASTLIDKPFGTCIDYTFAATALLRSKGIPVSIDYTPQWPDRSMGHYWNTVLTERRKKYEFNGFESNPSEEHYPDAKFAKVFRMTYKPNSELLELIHQGRALPPTLSNIFCKDVTDEYLETSDITVRLFPGRPEGDNVYLAVFNNFEWKPIYWGYVRGNKARFKGMGRNVLYLPVLWKNEKPIPVGDPFFLDMTGDIRYVRPDTTRHQNIRVNRKFPPLRHVCARREYLRLQPYGQRAMIIGPDMISENLYPSIESPISAEAMETTFCQARNTNCFIGRRSIGFHSADKRPKTFTLYIMMHRLRPCSISNVILTEKTTEFSNTKMIV